MLLMGLVLLISTKISVQPVHSPKDPIPTAVSGPSRSTTGGAQFSNSRDEATISLFIN